MENQPQEQIQLETEIQEVNNYLENKKLFVMKAVLGKLTAAYKSVVSGEMPENPLNIIERQTDIVINRIKKDGEVVLAESVKSLLRQTKSLSAKLS